jgi:hypothetical protein
MKKLAFTSALFFVFSWLINLAAEAQGNSDQKKGLFDSDEVLNITLSGRMRELVNDTGDDAGYHALTLSYKGNDSSLTSIPIKVKTRGHFRRKQGGCSYPPLMLNFSKEETPENSFFHKQDKMKLVTPCRGDKYVVREYLVYKLSNLITSKSFRARLVKVVYEDTRKGKKSDPLYGILLEEEEQMAKRNHMITVEKKLRPEQTQAPDFLKMAVFEYLIGNTDWSIQYLQNIKLIATDSTSKPFPVPYDFDHAGIVSAPYAKPAEALLLSSVHERRYRGYCIPDMVKFEEVFAFFRQVEKEIYGVYKDCSYVDESYISSTINYLDEFYKTINDPVAAKTAFTYPCDKNGTGNVVIMGLDKN